MPYLSSFDTSSVRTQLPHSVIFKYDYKLEWYVNISRLCIYLVQLSDYKNLLQKFHISSEYSAIKPQQVDYNLTGPLQMSTGSMDRL